jgi:DNA-binding MarR family transcriptional regulator
VTFAFDDAVRFTGLRASQVVVLRLLAAVPHRPQAELARRLAMDASTLSRNLKPLIRRGLVEVDRSAQDGSHRIAPTSAGTAQLKVIEPIWRQTGQRLLASEEHSDVG